MSATDYAQLLTNVFTDASYVPAILAAVLLFTVDLLAVVLLSIRAAFWGGGR